MKPAELTNLVTATLTELAARRDVQLQVPTVTVQRPKQASHGDWTTNVAMQVAKAFGCPPREVATELAEALGAHAAIAQVDVAGPGFLNITLDTAALGQTAHDIVTAGARYGSNTDRAGVSYNIEYVSANPTGPIHLGGTRWAAVGNALHRVLEFNGATVTSEYYFNDHGAQVTRFAKSLLAASRNEPAPEDGYAGGYINDIAARVLADHPEVAELDGDAAVEAFRSHGVNLMFDDIKTSLKNFGVEFDVYFHEDSVHESGAVKRAVQKLDDMGYVFEKDGAQWLRTTDHGDDKDRVFRKSDGDYAYFAGDLAYYRDKRERGFDRNIIILGADHSGYVSRMMAMCAAFGDTPGQNLQILIGQLVNLVKDGQPVRMSKRAGTVVVLEDLVDAVGVDAARYSLTRSSMDNSIDIDVNLLTSQSNDNPVYYVQYAHARTCAVARKAAEAGVSMSAGFAPELLTHSSEATLLTTLEDFPRIVRLAADGYSAHVIPHYLEELARCFHAWYSECRVMPRTVDGVTEPVGDVHHTRLWLAAATRQVLANGLSLVGVSAPERM